LKHIIFKVLSSSVEQWKPFGRFAATIKREAFDGGTAGATHPSGGRQQWPEAIVGTTSK